MGGLGKKKVPRKVVRKKEMINNRFWMPHSFGRAVPFLWLLYREGKERGRGPFWLTREVGDVVVCARRARDNQGFPSSEEKEQLSAPS